MRIAPLACAIAAVLAAGPSLAAWEAVPDVTFAVGADDNPRLDELDSADTGTAASAWVDASVALSNRTERSVLFLEPRLRADSYADNADSELESEDLFFTARAERRSATGGRLGLQSFLSRESILSSELLEATPIDPDVADPLPIDTGVLVLPDEHRTRISLGPYFETPLSERSSLLLDARFQDVSYSGPPLPSRTDFRETQLAAGIARNLDDRNRATARVIVADFEADATRNQTDSVGVEGTFERELSSIWRFALTTGLRRSEIRYVRADEPGEDVDTSATLGIGFRKRTDLARVNVDLQRLVTPNASGYLERRDEFRVSLSRQVAPRLTADVALRLIDTSALGDVEAFGREYVRASFGVQWAWQPQWSLDVGFDTITQKFLGQTGDQTSNRLRLGLNFRGLSRAPQ